MSAAYRYLAVALMVGVLAAACAAAAVIERGMAAAQRDLAVANLDAADRGYAAVERRLSPTARMSWLLAGTHAEIAARRTAIRYWRADYAELLRGDAALPDDPGVSLTLANAVYRAGLRADASPQQALDGLDRTIALYAGLLRDGDDREDVAYNYEFLVTLRALVEEGAEPVGAPLESPLGQEGAQPLDDETGLDDVQIYVPMMQDDRDTVDDPTPGGDPPIRRRG